MPTIVSICYYLLILLSDFNCLDFVKLVDLNGKLKCYRQKPSEFEFDFNIDSIGNYNNNNINNIFLIETNRFINLFLVTLTDSVLAFHTYGMSGRSFINDETVQEINDPSRCFKVIGADQTVILESKPANSNTSNTPSNLYILTGHENSY